MAGGRVARSHWAMFGVVFLVFLIPVVLAEAAPPIHSGLPNRLLSELFQPNAAPPGRGNHAPVQLVPDVPPHQDQAGTSALKEGPPTGGGGQVKHQLPEGLLSKWPTAQKAGCHKVGKDVTCEGAKITEVPADLGNGTESITFQYTSLTVLPNGAFQKYPDLQTIEIFCSSLARVEAGAFRGISKLGTLTIFQKRLKTITTFEHNTFEGVSSLENVTLENIGLKAVPEYLLKNATNVTVLHLSHNQITTIEALPHTLQKLEKLFLNDNKITTVDANVCNMSTVLTELYLQENMLTDVSFNGCSSVKTLDISYNSIKTLRPNAFTKMDHLKILKLAGNQLDMISNLEMIPQLESLDISGNNITTIRNGDFNKQGNLQTLTARDMGSRFTVEKGALNLRLLSVDFSLNPAINITTETLLSPPNITHIDLRGCGIEMLNGTAIMNKDSLKTLDLSSNPLVCDCEARWMPKSRDAKKPWAMAWGVKMVSPRCGSPAHFIPDISNLTIEDFACEVPKLESIFPTNITVDWLSHFNFTVNLTRGYPLGKWTRPPGEYIFTQSNDQHHTEHFVLTFCLVDRSNFKGTVNFTLVATNVVGDTRATFYVTQIPDPRGSATKGGPLNKFYFVVMMIITLLLSA